METDDSPHTYQIVFKDGVILVLEYIGDEGLDDLVVPSSHNVKFTKGRTFIRFEDIKPQLERFKIWIAPKNIPVSLGLNETEVLSAEV
jgi:hypothetical protein